MKTSEAAQLIRALRKHLGLTQEKMAAKLGVSFPTINRWENGRALPSPLALQKIQQSLIDMGKEGKKILKKYFPDS